MYGFVKVSLLLFGTFSLGQRFSRLQGFRQLLPLV